MSHNHAASCGCAFNDSIRRDPTNTKTLRAKFEADAVRRFRSLKGLISQALVELDVLGLNQRVIGDSAKPVIIMDASLPAPRAFEFSRSGEKVAQFMGWLEEAQSELILGVSKGTSVASAADNAWSNTYIDAAYIKGIRDSSAKLRKAGARVEQSWINSAFQREIHADRLGLIYTRTYSDLDGITKAMDQQISRVLAEGIGTGRGPADIARRINNRVDKIGITRARMLARTEVIAAHANASLNNYAEAGIEGVDVEAEWLTAADPCPECEALSNSGPYTLQEAQGLIPAHPNCRCSWSPKVVNGTGITLV